MIPSLQTTEHPQYCRLPESMQETLAQAERQHAAAVGADDALRASTRLYAFSANVILPVRYMLLHLAQHAPFSDGEFVIDGGLIEAISAHITPEYPAISHRTIRKYAEVHLVSRLGIPCAFPEPNVQKATRLSTLRNPKRKSLSETRKLHVLQRDGYACVECFSTEDLTVDHIVPVVKGGTNHLDNLRTLCRTCNSRKGAR